MIRNPLYLLIALGLCLTSYHLHAQDKPVELRITGLKKTKERFVKRIAKVKDGMSIDSTKIIGDVERLKRLDGIAHTTYRIEEQSDRYLVYYEVDENFTIIPGLRIGQASDGSFAFRASLFEFNALGQNVLFGGFYQREVFNSYGIFLESPYLFTNKLGLGINYQDVTTRQPVVLPSIGDAAYNFRSQAAEAKLLYEYNFRNRMEAGVRFFKEEYTIILEELPLTDIDLSTNLTQDTVDKRAIFGSYEHIKIDLEYHLVRGYRNELFGEVVDGAKRFLNTDYRLQNTTEYFARIGKKGNWANRLQLHWSTPTESPFAPIVVDNQLNIRGSGNIIDRGTAAIFLNTEYRHTFLEKGWFVIQGNAFVDAGTLRRPGVSVDNLWQNDTARVFPGLGIRLIHKRIVNAVLRFDYGIGITENFKESGIVFGIGQYF